MRTAIVIPARLASTRLPGKPLLADTGRPLICHVLDRARQVPGIDLTLVATDDDQIAAAVQDHGGQAVLTRSDHLSGTDRIAEVASGLDVELIINLQGDEPHFDPSGVKLLQQLLVADPHADMATLATPIRDASVLADPNRVKVVVNDQSRALLFSRSPIPFARGQEPDFSAQSPQYLLHLGVYAYRRDYLLKLAATPPHWLEQLEQLEQLRALGTGGTIAVGIVASGHHGIDTPADYKAFVDQFRAKCV